MESSSRRHSKSRVKGLKGETKTKELRAKKTTGRSHLKIYIYIRKKKIQSSACLFGYLKIYILGKGKYNLQHASLKKKEVNNDTHPHSLIL